MDYSTTLVRLHYTHKSSTQISECCCVLIVGEEGVVVLKVHVNGFAKMVERLVGAKRNQRSVRPLAVVA